MKIEKTFTYGVNSRWIIKKVTIKMYFYKSDYFVTSQFLVSEFPESCIYSFLWVER